MPIHFRRTGWRFPPKLLTSRPKKQYHTQMKHASLKEKIGYGFGDMASSMFWKIFSAYLPFFYTNVFGLPLEMAGILFLVTKLWDAVSDPMMGMMADRTHSRWGKYRPWLLFMALPFAVCGVLQIGRAHV